VRRRRAIAGTVAVALVAAVVLVVLLDTRGPETVTARSAGEAVPYDGRSPREPAAAEQRVLVELGRPALGALDRLEELDGTERRAYVASLTRERQALRSALAARGVRLRGITGFERTWNGFAATVRTRDLAAISSLGVRAQPVRRFYASTAEPVALGRGRGAAPGLAPGAPVALLASGVRPGHPSLVPGADVVDRDPDPAPGADPRDRTRRETSGTILAGALARAGRRVRPIRIAALRAPAAGTAAGAEEYATTDTLLAGLERAVDPDGDGDPGDAPPVALVGVHAPYAGFAGSPEGQAVAAASALGTLVVAPAGHEGVARPPNGTIASPAAASEALAVGALAASPPVVELRTADLRVRSAVALGGDPPREAPAGAGRLAIVRAGADPAARAAAAAAAGARAVLLAEPRPRRALPAMAAGRVPVPVVGVTGAAARAVLALPPGTRIRIGRPRPAARRESRSGRRRSPREAHRSPGPRSRTSRRPGRRPPRGSTAGPPPRAVRGWPPRSWPPRPPVSPPPARASSRAAWSTP
jgi:hypothetical protein